MVYSGIAQMGGGVSTLARMVLGTYFEKNCPCSKGHLLGLGGLNPCKDGLGHLCSENWSSNGICSSRSGNKVPHSARLSEGRCNRYLGNARIDPASFSVGLPLQKLVLVLRTYVLVKQFVLFFSLQYVAKCISIFAMLGGKRTKLYIFRNLSLRCQCILSSQLVWHESHLKSTYAAISHKWDRQCQATKAKK